MIFKQPINILMNLEDVFLGKIRHYLPDLKQRPSGIIFKRPYCQKDDYATPAKTYSSTKLKATSITRKMPLDLNAIHVAPVENSMRF